MQLFEVDPPGMTINNIDQINHKSLYNDVVSDAQILHVYYNRIFIVKA